MVTSILWIYLALLLAGLIVVLILWIMFEKRAQERYKKKLYKLKKNAELRIIA